MSDLQEALEAASAGRYHVEREIGHGGMGVVFLARDTRHDRHVVLKVIRPEIARSVSGERFAREIRIAAAMQHPHILPLHDSGNAGGLPYYVTPFVQGESLRERLKRERQLPVADAVRLATEVAEALTHAHDLGVVHRDIKPANILLSGGHALVADFGIARAVSLATLEPDTTTGVAVGTPGYMSPEQACGEAVIDGRSDVYGLGCVLYEMLAGEPPFTGPNAQAILARQLNEAPRSIRVVRPSVPTALEVVLETALAKVPADRFPSALEFARALAASSETSPKPARARHGPRFGVAALVVVVFAAWAAWSARQRVEEGTGRADSNLVAIAPFDALSPELAIWQEGLMDLVSRNLDQAGALRTVPPTMVLRNWEGRSDRTSAERLARRSNAGLVVVGTLVPSGKDSVRLLATLLKPTEDRVIAEIELRGPTDRMDQLSDSLSLALLGQIGQTRAVAAVRLTSLKARSLPALKAYLEGEQYFRRTAWDSALARYERAAQLDTAFALAVHRLHLVRTFGSNRQDSLTWAYALRAGRLNHGLAPRESLLVAAESLMAAVQLGFARDPLYRTHLSRLFSTLDLATRRVPTDPESWYYLGFARYQWGPWAGVTARHALDALDRSISLDSAFAPAYVDAIPLAMRVRGPSTAERYIKAYLQLNPSGGQADGLRLAAMLLSGDRARSQAVTRALDTASSLALFYAVSSLTAWPDPAETAVRVARRLAGRRTDAARVSPDPAFPQYFLAFTLASRGHGREAYGLMGNRRGALFAQLAVLGAVPRDSAAKVFDGLERESLAAPSPVVHALPWWCMHGDTVSLRRVAGRAEAWTRATTHPLTALFARYLRDAALAYLALAKHDSLQALAGFLALPDTVCTSCDAPRYDRIRLLVAQNRNHEARTVLAAEPVLTDFPLSVLWILERARVAERLKYWDEALADYSWVADMWIHADPELQPAVTEARRAVSRLRQAPRERSRRGS